MCWIVRDGERDREVCTLHAPLQSIQDDAADKIARL